MITPIVGVVLLFMKNKVDTERNKKYGEIEQLEVTINTNKEEARSIINKANSDVATINGELSILKREKQAIENDLKNLNKQLTIEEEKEEEEEEEEESTKIPPAPFEKIRNLFNSICKSYSSIRTISTKRKEHIRARWKQHNYKLEVFEELFNKAEGSHFLKGQNDRKWKADFDWLINDNNMTKVLEGKYENKGGGIFVLSSSMSLCV